MESLPIDKKHKAFKKNFDSCIKELEDKYDDYWGFVYEHAMEVPPFVEKKRTEGNVRLWYWDDYDACPYHEGDENFDHFMDESEYMEEIKDLDCDEFLRFLDENLYFENGYNKHLLTVRYCAQLFLYKESDFK
tara:strand:+ start:200 stop:598 length:399 start_codon:yes stop_codon:yes gene_type:complete